MKKMQRKIPTPQNLANVALHYLERYAASEASLRRVLDNRLRRAMMDHPDFAADDERKASLRSAIETIIEKHKRTGTLDDAAFAALKVSSLRRQGRSQRAIQQKLGLKGIKSDLVAKAITQEADGLEPQEAELKAAMTFIKRRKIGPFRKGVADDDKKRKEFATLARAGFSSDIVRRVLKAELPEEPWD
jgi:regulatory protein